MKQSRRSPDQPIPLSERPTLNVDEFCAMVGFARSTFYKAVAAGDLVPCKYGKRTFVTQDEMKRFVKNMLGNRSQPR